MEPEEHPRRTMQGPDAKCLTNHVQVKQQMAPLPDSTPELDRRKEVMYEIDTDSALQHVAKATSPLGCYLRSRVRAAKEDDAIYDIEALTAHAVDFGSPELAEAAEVFMKQHYQHNKAGEVANIQATVGPITWGEDDEPGHGILTLAGLEWAMLDYRDKLALDDETVAALDGLPHSVQQEPLEIELRECAILNVVAAHLISNTRAPPGGWPSALYVQEEGLVFR